MELDLYVAMHYSSIQQLLIHYLIMFALLTAILDSTTVNLLLSFMGWVAVGALLLLFKPLLTGIARALLLLVKPHLTKEQRIARRNTPVGSPSCRRRASTMSSAVPDTTPS